jgi:aminoglycoside 6'-N-acetyltransferase I
MTGTNSPPTVRHVTPADREAWLRLRNTFWPEDGLAALARDVDAFLAGGAHVATLHAALLAVDGAGRAIGFAELSIRPYAEGCRTDRVCYLEGWYVDPGARQQGVGRALVEAAEVWGRARGCTEFASDAKLDNHRSAAAHAALGFTEVDRIRCFRKPL